MEHHAITKKKEIGHYVLTVDVRTFIWVGPKVHNKVRVWKHFYIQCFSENSTICFHRHTDICKYMHICKCRYVIPIVMPLNHVCMYVNAKKTAWENTHHTGHRDFKWVDKGQ